MSGKKSSSVSGNPFGFRASSRSSEPSKSERSGSGRSSESSKSERSSNTGRHNNSFKSEGIWGTRTHQKTERATSSPHVDRFSKPEKHIRIFTPERSNIDSSERSVRIFSPRGSNAGTSDRQVKAFTSGKSYTHVPERERKTLVPRSSGSDFSERQVKSDSRGRPEIKAKSASSQIARDKILQPQTKQLSVAPKPVSKLASKTTGHSHGPVLQNRLSGETTKVISPQKSHRPPITTTLRNIMTRGRSVDGNSANQNRKSGFKAVVADGMNSTDNQLGRTDAPRERFATQDGAARAALQVANSITRKTGAEAGGVVYLGSDGLYSYTTPITGTETEVEPFNSRPPGETDTTAYYHTHPDSTTTDSANFSEDDKKLAEQKNVDGYLGRPDGSVREYDHETNEIQEVGFDPISGEF